MLSLPGATVIGDCWRWWFVETWIGLVEIGLRDSEYRVH